MAEICEQRLMSLPPCKTVSDYLEQFLKAFDFPKASIAKAKRDMEKTRISSVGKQITFIECQGNAIASSYDLWLKREKRSATRFLFLTDGVKFKAVDLLSEECVSGATNRVGSFFEFFLPLIGKENKTFSLLGKPDVKAGEELAHIRNLLVLENEAEKIPAVNNFIYDCFVLLHLNSLPQFKGKIAQYFYRNVDESKKNTVEVLNAFLEEADHELGFSCRDVFGVLPVEGLSTSKDVFVSLSTLFEVDWSEIDTDAIGSVIQNIQNGNGAFDNFTSYDNVLKVIGPLFLNKISQSITDNVQNNERLVKIEEEILKLKLFDPCAGTGSFLVISYKELDDLLKVISTQLRRPQKHIKLDHFLGIEDNSFSCLLAKFSLSFAVYRRTGNLVHAGNAFSRVFINSNPLRIEWDKIGRFSFDNDTYIFGNVDYSGARKLSASQKEDKSIVLSDLKGAGELDYASCWFVKGAKAIEKFGCKLSFVSTNSILQGEQVWILWGALFDRFHVSISFLYKPFKWNNASKNKTGVTVIIVGLEKNVKKATLYDGSHAAEFLEIGPYFTGDKIIVLAAKEAISNLPKMIKGNMPYDEGHLSKVGSNEKREVCSKYPGAAKFFKRLVGSDEFINDITRWCLWIHDEDLEEAMNIPEIAERINKTRNFRLSCSDKNARKLGLTPYKFREDRETKKYSIVIPSVSSERRPYIPIGFVDKNTIVSNLAFVIYNPEMWVFGVLLSRMHNIWVRNVCGGLETRIRYSNLLGYNTFPLPVLSKQDKEKLANCALAILRAREAHSELSLGDLYSSLPPDLLELHSNLDLTLEKMYKKSGFGNDSERLSAMLKLYRRIVYGEK